MPYFAWRGVTLAARIQKGTCFARNTQELDAFLLKKDIALLSCSSKKIWWNGKISLQAKIDYIMQLAMLMKAGVLLPNALRLVADQAHRGNFAIIAHSIADHVEQGLAFSLALQKQSATFNPLIIQMAAVGQESGSLPAALQVLSNHLESLAFFKARLRSALLLPLVTFIFFLVIIVIMLVVIVPQFASIFASMQKEVPGATKTMIMMSNFLRGVNFWLLMSACVAIFVTIKKCLQNRVVKKRMDTLFMHVPGINSLLISKNMAGFFQALSLLLQGGMPLVKAVHIANESIDNNAIKNAMKTCEQEINAGVTLADALAGYENYCAQDMISLIKVGQESGQLAPMLERVAGIYQQRLIHNLSRINTLFQPFLLIILGLMITGLILALYTPIMGLSYAV